MTIQNLNRKGIDMHNEISTPISRSAAGFSASPWLRTCGVVVGGSLLLAACAHLSLPLWFTPVPLSAQPFAVLLLGLVLGPRLAATTMIAYLAEGIVGLPVFAPGIPGAAHLFGPTGGYLMAYPVAAVLVSMAWRSTQRGFFTAFASAVVGDLLILACGAAWLTVLSRAHMSSVFSASVLAFVPGDMLKAAAAAGMAWGGLRIAHTYEGRS
jgi:biotin transport system substrate-specific component